MQGKNVTVWADKGQKDIIIKVEGVTNVFDIGSGFDYSVYIDPRYDREYVKEAIKAAILIGEGE